MAVPAGGGEPLYRSTPRSGKHADPVWQVAWQRTAGHELQLASISTDGRVTLWTVSRNELQHQDLMELRRLRGREQGDSGSGAEPAGSSRPATSGSSSSHATAAVQGAGEEAGAGIAGATLDVCCHVRQLGCLLRLRLLHLTPTPPLPEPRRWLLLRLQP